MSTTTLEAEAARRALREAAPHLADLTEHMLFGQVWSRPQLCARDRSLITCTALVALGKTEQMKTHFPRAIRNGVTHEELIEMITHMAFYSGWPSAVSAALAAREILGPTPAAMPEDDAGECAPTRQPGAT